MPTAIKSILEDHGFNGDVFLFGTANLKPIRWLEFNQKQIGGFVGRLHFTAPALSGLAALIASDDTANCEIHIPDGLLLDSLSHFPEKQHIKSIIHGFREAAAPNAQIEASFVGSGYHLDFMRGNFAIPNNNNQTRFPSTLANQATLSLETNSSTPTSRIKSKVQLAKFGVQLDGVEGLIISISASGGILIACHGPASEAPSAISIGKDGIILFDQQNRHLTIVNSPELQSKIKAPLAKLPYYLCFNNKEVMEWRKLAVAE